MLVLEGKLAWIRIHSWCNVFHANVVVPVGKITHVIFHSPFNVVVRNSIVLVLEVNIELFKENRTFTDIN